MAGILLRLFVTLLFALAAPEKAPKYLRDDLSEILSLARWSGPPITLSLLGGAPSGTYTVRCSPTGITLSAADPDGFASAIRELGIFLPHPRWAFHDGRAWRLSCGKGGRFRAKLPVRGFHFHLQHPSEFVTQFLEGDREGARETLRWLTWNHQNLLQLQLLRTAREQFPTLRETLLEAKTRGLYVSLSVSFVLAQQKSYTLLPWWAPFFPGSAREQLKHAIDHLARELPFDSLVVELGTTEFTPSPREQTLSWMETVREHLAAQGKALRVKVHVSTNQTDKKNGNFNFLPRAAHPGVGVLPHTVHYFSLADSGVSMYGRNDFRDMEAFLHEESSRREVWYYPETSYYVGLDIDIPLLLTDYLRARAADWKRVPKLGARGHVTFTTGQELGYWLFDWTTALLAEQGVDNPLTALQLLGEKKDVWRRILDFETRHIKEKRLLPVITASNLLDELPFSHPILDRNLLRSLHKKPDQLAAEISALEEAVRERPPVTGVRNDELRALLTVTWLRIDHALALRKFLATREPSYLTAATHARREALAQLQQVPQRWAGTLAWATRENPTSYPEGYAATAARLHFWEREEGIVREGRWNPFYRNIYSPWRLLF